MNEIISQQELEKVIAKGVAFIDFNTPWCAPCRAQEPILEKLVKYYKGTVYIASMNIDKNNDTAVKLGIQSIPTLIIYKNGKEIQRFVGLQSEDFITNALDKIVN
ncbi:Thioredoxin [Candidatus Magnetomorum sp. HK-1]|nr:Thioredoxin [Candidatus Magnetomorum sp. HK-1]